MTQVATPPAAPARPLYAADIMVEGHPLYKTFIAFLGGKEPTKRQARAFLAKYPQYRG
jgi:hypothetical protein